MIRVTVSSPSTSRLNATTNWKSNASNEKVKRNVAKTLAIVTACYFICWMPDKIYIILYVTGIMFIISSFQEFWIRCLTITSFFLFILNM